MKKHLIAAAVAGALAVPAMAQVTVYGRLDTGYNQRSSKVDLGTNSKASAIGFSAHSSSRFGIKGSEDLGGGLKASFLVEQQLAESNSKVLGSTKADASKALGGRGMWAGLSGTFGEMRIGLQNQFSKDLRGDYTSSGGSNVIGDPLLGSGGIENGGLAGDFIDARYTGISYRTPSFSGLKAGVGIVSQKLDVTESNAKETNSGSGTELMVQYKAGPISAALVYGDGSEKEDNVKSDSDFTFAGLSYNFGVAAVYLSYADVKAETKATNEKFTADYTQVGVKVPLGSASVFANYTDGSYKSGNEVASRDDGAYQVGATYKLSKRTYLYAIHGAVDTEVTQTIDLTEKQTAIGVVHSF
jgi:general bacterial porin, GBP family